MLFFYHISYQWEAFESLHVLHKEQTEAGLLICEAIVFGGSNNINLTYVNDRSPAAPGTPCFEIIRRM